jgi:hypothetical protein
MAISFNKIAIVPLCNYSVPRPKGAKTNQASFKNSPPGFRSRCLDGRLKTSKSFLRSFARKSRTLIRYPNKSLI